MDAIDGSGAPERSGAIHTASSPGRGLLRRLLSWLALRNERARQRRALVRLDDAGLRDIGLTQADVAMETAKPFWRD
jgi:uncharacterized protein YjiS (DUF1127 family)